MFIETSAKAGYNVKQVNSFFMTWRVFLFGGECKDSFMGHSRQAYSVGPRELSQKIWISTFKIFKNILIKSVLYDYKAKTGLDDLFV